MKVPHRHTCARVRACASQHAGRAAREGHSSKVALLTAAAAPAAAAATAVTFVMRVRFSALARSEVGFPSH